MAGTSGAWTAIAVAILLAGCAGTGTAAQASRSPAPTPDPSPTELGTLTLTESFDEMSAQLRRGCTLKAAGGPIRSGRIGFAAVNETDAEAWLDLGRISDGHSYEELAQDIGKARQSAEAGGPVIHRPSYLSSQDLTVLDAGESTTKFATVQSGTYAIVCLRMFETVAEVRPFAVIGPLQVEE